MSGQNKYQMNISNTVLYHLGINLYSNVPAVLSEVVANSWDADATSVDIEIGEDIITIVDDGHGMTLNDINKKYLFVGFERREDISAVKRKDGTEVTPRFEREVMGRKGIGKLSLFSIAETITVETIKKEEKNGFVMSKQHIDDHIDQKNEQPYAPKPILKTDMELDKNGTRIVLTNLKKRITKAHPDYLKKRIARRFSVMGDDFMVIINGDSVEITDRDYFHKLQYLWHYGDDSEKYVGLCNNLENPEHNEKRDGTIKVTDEDNIENLTDSVKGWIGTVRKPKELADKNVDGKEDINENLNKIVVMVRGKLAQENILDDFRQSGFYTKYLIGEIHADFLDMDNLADIATTSRQEIIKDNPRYEHLKIWMKDELFHIRDQWDKWRDDVAKKEVYQIPAIKEWLDELKPKERKHAESLFRKIGEVHVENDDDRKQLYIHTALAFEKLLYKGHLDKLETLSIENLPLFMEVVGDFDDFEASLYYQIIQERLRIISILHQKIDDNSLEKVIQQFLYNHIWLLDPSWYEMMGTPDMEQNVKKEFDKLDAKLSPEEKRARYDIKYKTTSGKHIIIELKRPNVTLDESTLVKQVLKYRNALEKLLEEAEIKEPVEVVCVVGNRLRDWDNDKNEEESKKAMALRSIRVVTYKKLIHNAYLTYREFLEKRKEAGRAYRLVKNI